MKNEGGLPTPLPLLQKRGILSRLFFRVSERGNAEASRLLAVKIQLNVSSFPSSKVVPTVSMTFSQHNAQLGWAALARKLRLQISISQRKGQAPYPSMQLGSHSTSWKTLVERD